MRYPRTRALSAHALRSLIAVLPLLLPAAALAAEKKPPDFKEQAVFQLVSSKESDNLGIAGGGGGMTVKDHNYQLAAKNAATGQSKSIVVVTPADGKIGRDLTSMKPGDYFTADLVHRGSNSYDFVSTFNIYQPKGHEDRPNVFLFVETSTQKKGSEDITLVKLYKLGMLATVTVPSIKDAGKNQPDPKIADVVASLKPGDSIEVIARGAPTPVIQTIEPYIPPELATFSKTLETDSPAGKVTAIEVTLGDETKTLLVPPKKSAASKLPDPPPTALLKQLKTGNKVMVRFQEIDGKQWLREIFRQAD